MESVTLGSASEVEALRQELARAEEARDQAAASFRDIMDGFLHEAESSFRTLVEALPEAVLIAQDGLYTWANPAAMELLQASASEQLVGLSPASLLGPGVTPGFVAAMTGTPTASGAIDGRWQRLDGTAVSVEVSSFKGMFNGRLAEIAVARDSTARNELATRLAQMDRLLAVGTLAAGVGHEINNPLAYVVSNLDYALSELRELVARGKAAVPAEVLEALDEAHEGAERVRAIVHDLKSFSRKADDERVPLDVRVVLDSAANMARSEMRHRAQLLKEYGLVPLVDANDSRLAQVFLNLLVNAAHAIPEGRADQNLIRVVARTAPDGGVIVEVHDTGSGIPAEVLPRVFDPFFTTKPVGRGTGLGLSICQNILRSYDGQITVESEVGRGTTFRVTLPPSKLEPVAPPEAEPTATPGPRARLLILDDEPRVASALRRGLRSQHEVEVCAHGQAALARLASGERFEVVLCDLMMPEMTGMEFFERLGALRPEYRDRIIFMTGGVFTETAQRFLAEVPNRRISKPFQVNELRELIDEVLAGELKPRSRGPSG